MNKEIITWLYKILLHREPENDSVIDYWLNSCSNIKEVTDCIVQSKEFRDIGYPIACLTGMEPPIISQLHYSLKETTQTTLFELVQESWSKLGVHNPYWGVLSSDDFQVENINKSSLDRFYQSGSNDVEHIIKIMQRNKINISHISNVFELGCGVGRISYHLAKKFKNLLCCDISKPMINLAQSYMNDNNVRNVDFLWLNKLSDIEKLPSFDLFFSVIVLQHSPPPIMSYMLEHIFMALNINGIGIFQIPTYIQDYSFNVEEYLNNDASFLHNSGLYEVHAMRQPDIFKLIKKCNCEVLEVFEYNVVGLNTGNQSLMFVIKKVDN